MDSIESTEEGNRMAKVKNTLRQPLDIEIQGGGNLHLGPRAESRELSEKELQSPQVKANLKAGNLVLLKADKKAKASTPKEADQ